MKLEFLYTRILAQNEVEVPVTRIFAQNEVPVCKDIIKPVCVLRGGFCRKTQKLVPYHGPHSNMRVIITLKLINSINLPHRVSDTFA